MLKIAPRYYPLVLIFLGILFYIPFLGRVHLFDWDEINFAESAREMLVTGNFTRVQINFEPFWEKPPLFFWMQATAMKIFGIGEFAARFPNALMGIITLVLLYLIGRRLYNPQFGLLWALGYLGSFTPHLYFKSGIIDPTFNFFIFLGVWYLVNAVASYGASPATRFSALAGFFIGLAVLTKGPVGALLPGLTFLIYWGLQRFQAILSLRNTFLLAGCALVVASLWFGLELAQNGWWFLREFIDYQIRLFSTPDAGHAQPFFYHFVVVLLGCFPISILAIRYLTAWKAAAASDKTEPVNGEVFRQWMVILFWVVLILFSIVRTKIVHYSSMAWFPVSYLAAYHLHQYLTGKLSWSRWTTIGLIFIGTIWSILLAAVPLVGMNAAALTPYIKDPFAVANLQAPVDWAGWEWLIGMVYGIAIIWWIVRVPRSGFRALTGLYLSTAICLLVYLAQVVPKIEQYTQGTVIDFYQAKQDQDVYVEPIGYKSYAQLFYFRKTPPVNPKTRDENYLLNGPVDKPTFLITKITSADNYRYNPNLELISEENGFVFFRRKVFR